MKYFLIFFMIFFHYQAFARLDFIQALSEIRKRSTDLPPVQAQVEAAEHFQLSKKLKFAPSLTAGYSKSEQMNYSSNTDALFLKSSLNIFNGGSDYADYQAGSFNLFASKAKQSGEVLAVENKATVAIVDYLQKSLNKNIFLGFKRSKRKSLKSIRIRFKRGLTSKQEVLKARVDLGIANARFKSVKISTALSRARLSTLLGHSNLKISWPLKNRLRKIDLKKLRQAEQTLDQRPDLMEAKFKMLRDENTLNSVKRSFLPKVDFSYTISSNTSSNIESDSRISLLTISIPLFSNWTSYSSFKSAQATSSNSKYNFKAKIRSAESEWESLKQNLSDNIQTALEREINVKLSRSLYKDNFKRFKSGRATVNDLQLDQNRLLESESQQSSGWASAHLAFLNFCHAKGSSILHCDI
jgi:outer membrane protein TolC